MYLRPGSARCYASTASEPFRLLEGQTADTTAINARSQQQNLVQVIDEPIDDVDETSQSSTANLT